MDAASAAGVWRCADSRGSDPPGPGQPGSDRYGVAGGREPALDDDGGRHCIQRGRIATFEPALGAIEREPLRGSHNPRAKLNEETVRAIKAWRGKASAASTAAKFPGVTRSNVSNNRLHSFYPGMVILDAGSSENLVAANHLLRDHEPWTPFIGTDTGLDVALMRAIGEQLGLTYALVKYAVPDNLVEAAS